jgi:hypothetical protein
MCVHCEEPVEDWDQCHAFMEPMHHACGFRAVAGSVAHIQKRCGCYVAGSKEEDPPGMTKRQAAEAALEAYLLNPDMQPEPPRWLN